MNKYQINKNSYEFDSVMLYILNLLTAASNYFLLIFVYFYFNTIFLDWISFSSLIMILGGVVNSLSYIVTRWSSKLEKKYDNYFGIYIIKKYPNSITILFILSTIIPLLLRPDLSLALLLLVGISSVSNGYFMIFRSYLLGLLIKRQIIHLHLSHLVVKFGLTIFLLITLNSSTALILGIIIANILSIMWFSIIASKNIPKSKINLPQIDVYKWVKNKEFLYTLVSTQLLSWIFYGIIFVSNEGFELMYQEYVGVVYSIGQIVHFGTISMLGSFISYQSNNKSNKILKKTLLYLTGLQTVIVLFLFLTYTITDHFFNILPDIYQFWLVGLLYTILVLMYNYLFTFFQYFISVHLSRQLLILIVPFIILILYILIINFSITINPYFFFMSLILGYLISLLYLTKKSEVLL